MSKIFQNKRKEMTALTAFTFFAFFFLIMHVLLMKKWLFSQLTHLIFVCEIEHFFDLWANFAKKSHLMIEWHWIFMWLYTQQLKPYLTETLRYLLLYACVFSLQMMFFLIISFVCWKVNNSSIKFISFCFSDFLSHSIDLMFSNF